MTVRRKVRAAFILLVILVFFTGCGSKDDSIGQDSGEQSAANGHIDFDSLQQLNSEIFAWIYVPGTNIDLPVAQSAVSDDFYESHNWKQEEDAGGCAYTEMANLMNMCDFNTVIHAKKKEDGTGFSELAKFGDQDFFDENGLIYLYLPDNVLTYQVVSFYTEDQHSILRDYNLVLYDGCEDYIQDLQQKAAESGIYDDGGEELTPQRFLLTLVAELPEEGRQEVLTAVLIQDAAGKIDRTIYQY